MSRTILIVGAGPIGRSVAHRLGEIGYHVRLMSRSGTGPKVPGVERVAGDARTDDLVLLSANADVIINATNPAYHEWAQEWPRLNNAFKRAAESASADLLLIGNYYGYPAGQRMDADLPLDPPTRKGAIRAEMWQDLRTAHQAGRFRVLELRASDYIGPESLTTPNAHAGARLVLPVLAGRTAHIIGAPDAPHSWTAVTDIARSVEALLSHPDAWGRPWLVPNAAPRSIGDVARDIAREAGAPNPRVAQIPRTLLRAAGLINARTREVLEMAYQFDQPFIADDTELTQTLGVIATDWDQMIKSTVAAARAGQRPDASTTTPLG